MPKRAMTVIVSATLGVGAAIGVAACGDDDATTTKTTTTETTDLTQPSTNGDQGGAPSGTPGVGVDQGDPGGAPSGTPGVGN